MVRGFAKSNNKGDVLWAIESHYALHRVKDVDWPMRRVSCWNLKAHYIQNFSRWDVGSPSPLSLLQTDPSCYTELGSGPFASITSCMTDNERVFGPKNGVGLHVLYSMQMVSNTQRILDSAIHFVMGHKRGWPAPFASECHGKGAGLHAWLLYGVSRSRCGKMAARTSRYDDRTHRAT